MRLQWLHFCWYWVMLFATGIYLLWCWESVDVQQWLVRFMFSLTNIYLCKKNFWDISAVVAELRFRCFCLSNLHFNSCIYDILYSTCYFQLQLVFAFSVVILQGVWICDSICQNGMITFLVLWIWRQRFLFSFSLFSRQCVQKYYSIRNLGNNKDFVLSLARFIKKSISCHAVDLTLETWLGLCSAFCLRPTVYWGGGITVSCFQVNLSHVFCAFLHEAHCCAVLEFIVSCGISETLSLRYLTFLSHSAYFLAICILVLFVIVLNSHGLQILSIIFQDLEA